MSFNISKRFAFGIVALFHMSTSLCANNINDDKFEETLEEMMDRIRKDPANIG